MHTRYTAADFRRFSENLTPYDDPQAHAHLGRAAWEAAEDAARLAHAGQLRKGTDVPYITHLERCARSVLEAEASPEIVAATWLHDAPEDTDYEIEAIQRDFGSEVALLVATVCEQKREASGRKRPWLDRKAQVLRQVQDGPIGAVWVFAADGIDACREMSRDAAQQGEAFWERFNAPKRSIVAYQRARLTVVQNRLGAEHPLAQQLAKAYNDLLLSSFFFSEDIPDMFGVLGHEEGM